MPKKLPPLAFDPRNPQSLASLAVQHLEWMRVRNYSGQTVHLREKLLRVFFQRGTERDIHRPTQVTKPILERYQRALYYHRNEKSGKPLSFRSQHGQLTTLKAYFKWLAQKNHILYNPASEIDLPKIEKRLPRNVLNAQEVERILNLPDTTHPLGVRDRAMLETFYSTGLRRMEVANLCLFDVDMEQGLVMVREGKGKKDRVVPIGERALAWVEKYIREVRPSFALESSEKHLFLARLGEPLSLSALTMLVKGYINAADIGKKGSCHLFRHTMATLMLENGADIRFIQEMLGHAELTSTQIYTHVSIRKLKEIHDATHPARLKPRAAATLDDEHAGREPLAPSAAPLTLLKDKSRQA